MYMLITDIVVWSCLCIHCILWYTLAQCLPCFLPTQKGPKCAPGRRWIKKGIHNCQKWGLTLLSSTESSPTRKHCWNRNNQSAMGIWKLFNTFAERAENQGAPRDQLFSIQLTIKLFHKAFTWLGSPPCPQQKRWVYDWVKVHWSLYHAPVLFWNGHKAVSGMPVGF